MFAADGAPPLPNGLDGSTRKAGRTMDTNHPLADGDLNELERRLAAWRPAADGLDPDSVLFAAGRASVRPSPARFAWPALAAGFACVAAVLGAALASERSERMTLALLLEQRTPTAASGSPAEPQPAEAVAVTELPASSYLAS